jgi:hypothetical protein
MRARGNKRALKSVITFMHRNKFERAYILYTHYNSLWTLPHHFKTDKNEQEIHLDRYNTRECRHDVPWKF